MALDLTKNTANLRVYEWLQQHPDIFRPMVQLYHYYYPKRIKRESDAFLSFAIGDEDGRYRGTLQLNWMGGDLLIEDHERGTQLWVGSPVFGPIVAGEYRWGYTSTRGATHIKHIKELMQRLGLMT